MIDRPEDGFKYLTLDSKIENSEILSQIESTLLNNGNRRIDAIIGKEGDIDVENLVGSGLIAAETSAILFGFWSCCWYWCLCCST